MNSDYCERITAQIPYCLNETSFSLGTKIQGKVRDIYDLGDKLALIATDRQSAFDRHIASIPYKGQVLNLTSLWWFEHTESILPNHVIAVPDPNVMLVKKCKVFPIEFVVRGYITGSTGTSLWTRYAQGERIYCGHVLPQGLLKNQKLDSPLLTPTTKDNQHDRPISAEEIIAQGWMTQTDWEEASQAVLKLFQAGQELAREKGLILVDTKYELGRDDQGRLTLVDEIHTPDSSRYWLAETYEQRISQGLEPEYIDKEFLRLWFTERCDPYREANLPKVPQDLIVTVAQRYIQLFELITGHTFHFTNPESITPRIMRNLAGWLN